MPEKLHNPIGNGLTYNFLGGSTGTHALNTAFVLGTSGQGIGYRFLAHDAVTLAEIFLNVATIAGTNGNIQMTAELRTISSANVIGSTVLASATAGSNGAGTWSRFIFGSPFTLTKGVGYVVIVYNTSTAPTVDAPTIRASGAFSGDIGLMSAIRTVNGFTAILGTNNNPALVLKFGNGDLFGMPYTNNNQNYTSNTVERGIYIPAQDVTLTLEALSLSAFTNISGLKIYKGATAPASTPGTGELSLVGAPPFGGRFGLNFPLVAGQDYRVIFTMSAAGGHPQFTSIPDHARFADVLACRAPFYSTYQNGSAWVTETEKVPNCRIYFKQLAGVGAGFVTYRM